MSASVTDRWVDFIADVSYDDLPSDVIQQTKMYILDHVGCALGGYAIAYGENVIKAGLELGGRPEATVIGSGDKLHCANAAYANGKLSNLTDADEVFYSTKHIGGIPVFSALSVGERTNSAPKDIILSTALAYDFAARCGFCGSIFKNDPAAGFVAGRAGTMAFGTFSAAIAALKMLKSNRQQTVDALTMAAHFAPGPMESKFVFSLSSTKYGDMGWFCHSGVIAALLAQHQYTGDTAILDGPLGLHKMTGALAFDYDNFVADLGSRWYIMDAGIKPYPTCRWFHTAIKLLEDIIETHALTPDDIEKIVVCTSPLTVGLPSYVAANNWSEAQGKELWLSHFSITYALACTIHGIVPGPEWAKTATLNNPNIAGTTKKITQLPHPDSAKAWTSYQGHPGKMHCKTPSSIEVHTKKGIFFLESSDLPGDSWNPSARLTDQQIIGKFQNNACHVLDDRKIERTVEIVRNLDDLDEIGPLMANLVR